MTEPLFVGEVRVDALPTQARPLRFAPYSSYPPIDADLSFAHAPEKTWEEIRRFIESRYVGPGVPAGLVKTTVRLAFRSLERTLEQEEVNREVAKLREALKEQIGDGFD
jgi:phenylalanyl-tRNA synthetase beta subunit